MQKIYPEIYKRDSRGNTRVWYMEQSGDKYRTFDGIYGGTLKSSAWRTAKPTNVGRSNERDGVAQATFEIESSYTKQLKGAYYEDVGDIIKGCRYIEPMLAAKYSTFEPGEAQPKLDGFRCILKADGSWSREGEELPGARHLVRALTERGVFDRAPNLVLDGELYNHEFKEDFGGLSSLIKKQTPTPAELKEIERLVQFHAYDILTVSPYPFKLLARRPRAERKMMLKVLVDALKLPMIQLVPSVDVECEEHYDEVHGEWVANGFEGSMFRPHDAYYEIGKRSKNLRKRKDFDEEEFDIVRIEEGEGNWAGAAKRVVCWLPDADRSQGPNEDNTFESGLRGTYEANVKLLNEDHKVASIRYFGWTPSAIPKPRFGVATKFWGQGRDL